MIHYTAMRDSAAAQARLCDPAAEVSAHWLIGRDGAVVPLVAEDRRAWHAGAGGWGGREDVNSRSIGIELDNPGDRPFAAAQMAAVEQLLAGILARWRIPARGVIAHSDMAPARKTDPGPRFDWRRLALAGLSVWPEAGGGGAPLGPAGEAAFAAALRAFGYPGAPAPLLLSAFRLRFRPWAHGPATEADLCAAADLARRFPVDPGGASA